jgi:ketosteroid isomerase-like protein
MDPDVERFVRDAYAAFVAGDLEALRQTIDPEAEWVNPPEAIEGGTRRGEAELIAMWRGLHDLFDLESVEFSELREAPKGVFALVRFRGRGHAGGVPVDVEQYHVIALQHGRIASIAWFTGRDDALAAAGLA